MFASIHLQAACGGLCLCLPWQGPSAAAEEGSWSITQEAQAPANLLKLIGLLSGKAAVSMVGVLCLTQAALADGSLSPRLCICPITKTCQDVSKIALPFFPFSPVGQTQTCLTQSPPQDLTCCLAVGVWVATGSSHWLR